MARIVADVFADVAVKTKSRKQEEQEEEKRQVRDF
jgi:hypothetical protein